MARKGNKANKRKYAGEIKEAAKKAKEEKEKEGDQEEEDECVSQEESTTPCSSTTPDETEKMCEADEAIPSPESDSDAGDSAVPPIPQPSISTPILEAAVAVESELASTAPQNSFHSIRPPLSPGTLSCLLDHYRFPTLTPVQAAVLPLFLTNKDVSVQAETGSGKTLSFLIPVVEMLLRIPTLKKRDVGGLILSPTRELAAQTYGVACVLCEWNKLQPPVLFVGGTRSPMDDLAEFKKHQSDIIIATPGRLDDLMTRYTDISFQNLECLILDEADVLLEMGFSMCLERILSKLPRMRRTGLFSATQSKAVKNLVRAGLRNPVVVNVSVGGGSGDRAESATPLSLTNYYLVCPLEEKLSRLAHFLKSHREEKCIVFFLTCACVEYYSLAMQQILGESFYLEGLHGKMPQKRRIHAVGRYREAKSGVLLCTDVASRGLDLPEIPWVLQFDAPRDPEVFVHRVGRSARAGKIGSSLTFLTEKESVYVEFLRGRKVPIEKFMEEGIIPPVVIENDVVENDGEDEEMEEDKDLTVLPTADGGTIPNVLVNIRKFILKDRELLEKGTKAYTSYIRAYKEHQCAFIFRFASMDLGTLATSFSLLRLPKMPELKDKLLALSKTFIPAPPEIDIFAIPFKDKTREKQRQVRLQKELDAGGKAAKQIKAEARLALRAQKEKDWRDKQKAKGRNPDKKRGRNARIMDEWEDLAKEERLYKKLRKKKITEEEYQKLMYGDNAVKDDDKVEDKSI